MTGRVEQGIIKTGDEVEVVGLKVTQVVKTESSCCVSARPVMGTYFAFALLTGKPEVNCDRCRDV